MDFIIGFTIFILSVTVTMFTGNSVVIPLVIGFFCFYGVGYLRGNSPAELYEMAKDGVRTSLVVIRLMVLIGALTALWRADGTIAFFLYHGISLITPGSFILICFLLTSVMSYFLGSSFAVVGTAGVMLMIFGLIGDVPVELTAGAVMSGAYFGDRTSPVSSSLFLTAAMTGTDRKKYTDILLKTGSVPFIISCILFGILSWKNPLTVLDTDILHNLSSSYEISFWAFVPALLILVLPWFKAGITETVFISIAASFIVGALVQGIPVNQLGAFMITGYEAAPGPLADTMNGGGILSLWEVILVIIISSSYAGLFEATEMLKPLKERIGKYAEKHSLISAVLIVSTISIVIFCNQTIAIIMSAYMLGDVYKKHGKNMELASDMGNTLITICGLVPWSVACRVPLVMMNAGNSAIPWCLFLWLNPLCYIFTKKFFKKRYFQN